MSFYDPSTIINEAMSDIDPPRLSTEELEEAYKDFTSNLSRANKSNAELAEELGREKKARAAKDEEVGRQAEALARQADELAKEKCQREKAEELILELKAKLGIYEKVTKSDKGDSFHGNKRDDFFL